MSDELDLDMSPSTIVATDAPDDVIPLDMDPPSAIPTEIEAPEAPAIEDSTPGVSLESTLSAIVAPVTGNTSGSLTDGTMAYVGFTSAAGYVTALANGVKQATADSYKATLRRRYSYTEDQIAALTINIIPEGGYRDANGTGEIVTHDGPNIFEQRRLARGLQANARMPVIQATMVQTAPAAPVMEGILPRAQIMRDLAESSPGVKVCLGRADRRMTHHTIAEITAALGTEFEALAPKLKSKRAQFGETMRGIKAGYEMVNSQVKVWCVTRRDVERSGEQWPSDLIARWCVGLLDGSAELGTLGRKTLVADLLVNDAIRFNGGTEEIRDHVIGTFVEKTGSGVFNSTDMLAWLRKTLANEWFALEVTGGYYVPGSHAEGSPLDRFCKACATFIGRDVTIDDVITGKRLASSLTRGLETMLAEIEADFAVDQVKAGEREALKAAKVQGATDADIELARRRAVVLPERANHYLVRLGSCQEYLDGLTKLIGDDTAGVRATLAKLDGMVRPLANALVVEMD